MSRLCTHLTSRFSKSKDLDALVLKIDADSLCVVVDESLPCTSTEAICEALPDNT